MSVQDDISKYESIRSATDQLAESGNYLLWQMVFYHALCLQLCDRFTPMELQPMVAELIARTNERIQERGIIYMSPYLVDSMPNIVLDSRKGLMYIIGMEVRKMKKDVCYGPIAPGQFFIDRMNPLTPIVWKTIGILTNSVLWCEQWSMIEKGAEWHFGVNPNDKGIQVAICNLKQKERVSFLAARHFAEQNLRHRDDDWRKQYAPNRAPVKIVRCGCGVGDDAPITAHAMNCFFRSECA